MDVEGAKFERTEVLVLSVAERSHAVARGVKLLLVGLLLGGLGSLGIPRSVKAQSGLVITGSEGVPVLSYRLDFQGFRGRLDRYRLTIPPQDLAVSEVQINGDRNFDGRIDPKNVRLEVEGQPVELDEVYWDEEFRSLEVVARQPIAAGQEMRLILSNVRNPQAAGIYRLEARVRGTEPNPLFRNVGNWLITIDDPERISF
ncbi:MAG: DUF2808 domain-containing protein [Cyanobacteriota bacterium]